MENSKARKEVINLGKLFVKELKLEPGVDTFSRWMAHYLAEKITNLEHKKGEEKRALEKECFDVILKLWQHRHSLPSGRRPLQSFEPVLDLLLKLNPDKKETFFYTDRHNQDISNIEIKELESQSVEEWIKIANEIDKTARIWIEYALSQAANKSKNKRTKEWIDNASGLSDNADTKIINILLDTNPLFNSEDYDKVDFSKNYAIEKLKKRISQLQKFSQLNETLLKAYNDELSKQ